MTALASYALYVTSDCHLCEQAQALFWEVTGAPAQEIEISADSALLERYGLRIPVLRRRDDGRELDWPFDAAQLRAFLAKLDAR